MHESSHDSVRAIEPIGGDLSIKFELIALEGNSYPEKKMIG